MSAAKVLVTGATGFLGGAVCHGLASRGWTVTATGRNESVGRELALAGFAFQRALLEKADETAALCADQQAVVHCAALSAPWGRREDFQIANVCATENILARAKTSGVQRFIHISTPSIYFDFRDRYGLTETSPLASRPVNAYTTSKLTAERLALAASSTDFSVIILRPRAIFGPGDTAIFPRLMKAAARGRLPVIGDGTNLASLTYIDNAVEAVACALDAPTDCDGQVFNITDGEPVALWQFIRELLGRVGLSVASRRVPISLAMAAAALGEGIGHVLKREPTLTRYGVGVLAYSQTLDIAKANRLLGYHPKVSTAEGVCRFAASLTRSSKTAI